MTRAACIAALLAPFITAPAAETAALAASTPASRPLVNERCPVTTDEFATPSHEIRWGEYSVRFCCEKCERRFQADPASYISNLPQLPPEVIEKAILDFRGDPRHSQAAVLVDRWMRPVMLMVVAVIGAWLSHRIIRRWRGPRSRASA
jgi:hypothetical protein